MPVLLSAAATEHSETFTILERYAPAPSESGSSWRGEFFSGGLVLPAATYEDSRSRLYVGDCRSVLATLPDACAQCCVTSPPYWGLRDYGLPPTEWPEVTFTPMAGLPPVTAPAWSGCLGFEPEPLAFVGHLVHVFREMRRVLAADGTLWLNLGDSYNTAGGVNGGDKSSIVEWQRPKSLGRVAGLKSKDLIGIPWRVAFALQADDWYLRSDCIWAKPNPMPESVTDRPTKAHEYVFLLTKSGRYFYDADAIREPHSREWWNESVGAEYMTPTDGRSDGGKRKGNGDPTGRNSRTVWTIASQPYRGAHFATMPPALAERCILAGSSPGETVLDPFNGAGTTGMVAMQRGRQYIGIELNPDYARLAVQRWQNRAAQEAFL